MVLTYRVGESIIFDIVNIVNKLFKIKINDDMK